MWEAVALCVWLGAVWGGSCHIGSVPGYGCAWGCWKGTVGVSAKGQWVSCKPGVGWDCCVQAVRGRVAAWGAWGWSQPSPWQHPCCWRLCSTPGRLPGAQLSGAAASSAVPDHPGAGDHPAARAAPSPSHISTARAEPRGWRWPPPRGLAPAKPLSSPSWTRRLQQRGKGGEKCLSSAQTLEPGPRRVPAPPSVGQTERGSPTHCDPAAPAPVPRCSPAWKGCGSS